MKIEEVDLELSYYSSQIRSGIFWITKEEQDDLFNKVSKVDKAELDKGNLTLLSNIFNWEL